MIHSNSRRTFTENFDAYRQAIQPTSQQVAVLCSSFAQMIADDSQDRVAVALSAAGINVVREPSRKGEKA